MKIKLIYQVSKGSFVGGLMVTIRKESDRSVPVIDTMTCRHPDQIIQESKFYWEFATDDPVCALDQHARMLFPATAFAYEPKDLRTVEYETELCPPARMV